MSEGKIGRITRHFKETLRHLDYAKQSRILRELTDWATPTPKRACLSVAERIRFKWWLRWKYGEECGYCHKPYDWRHGLTIDHLQPLSKGGPLRDIQNMVLACAGCNQAKGNAWL